MSENGKSSKTEVLLGSTDMAPIQGTVDLDIPISVLWEAFTQANSWAGWNECFYWARNRDLIPGKMLIWCFQPLRWWLPYKMPAIANIVEVEKERKVTWEVSAMPGFYARHTYHMEDLGDGKSRFGSWEQAMGAQIRFPPTKKFWKSHFEFVKDRSLEGARYLEEVYKRDGYIAKANLKPRRYWKFWLSIVLLLVLLSVGTIGGWFYFSYLHPSHIELAPGAYAVTAGGNSLIVKDGNDVLVVDTKFPPASDWLRNWIADNIESPVTMVVNTHYHYDHIQGNTNYPTAKIYAHRKVPELLEKNDKEWADRNPAAIPQTENLVDETATLKVGAQDVVVTYSSNAHTHGDLWVYLKRGDKEIVVTGDLFPNGYYPFMDLGDGGIDVPGLVKTVRFIANKYPNATFLPGHGELATAEDVNRFADYLEFLNEAVVDARSRGLSEDEAASSIDLTRWNLSALPSYHDGTLCWATAEMNIRWIYQIQAGSRIQKGGCKF